jgi:hypothetical protein
MAAARIVFIAGSSGDDDPEAKARIPTQDISMMQRTKHFMVGKFLFGFREGTTTSAKEMAANISHVCEDHTTAHLHLAATPTGTTDAAGRFAVA